MQEPAEISYIPSLKALREYFEPGEWDEGDMSKEEEEKMFGKVEK